MEDKIRHLEMIQSVINRLAGNSFMLKGWSITLVAALFALAAPDTDIVFVCLAYIPAGMFWALDGYFLWQEQLFRDLYEDVRLRDEGEIDFSMDTGRFTERRSYSRAVLSKTLIPFHGVLIVAIIIVMFLGLAAIQGASNAT